MFTKEQIVKAAACNSVNELIAFARTEGFDFSKDEAEKYFAELQDKEVRIDDVGTIAGGMCIGNSCGCDCNPSPCIGNC